MPRSTTTSATSASVDLTVHRCATLTSADVTNGGTLLEGVCYQAQRQLAVNGGTLVVEPGVLVEFGPNAYLTINSGGQGITVYGGSEMVFENNTASSAHVLAYVDISNAGSQAWFGGGNSQSSVHVAANGSLALSNATFAKTTGYAVIVSGAGSLSC
jgi:hypothetical protein